MEDAYVVDASVAIKLFLDEEHSDRARALFSHLVDNEPVILIAPELILLECASALWKYVRRYGYDTELARENLRDLGNLEIQTVSVRPLLSEASDEAQCRGITIYDACYVTLARQIGRNLITADRRLVRHLEGTHSWILYLGDCDF